MFEDAKIVTSKFLKLKNNLDNAMNHNYGFFKDREMRNSHNITELREAFGDLCILLHELTINESDTSDT